MPVLDKKLIHSYQTLHGEEDYGKTSVKYVEAVLLAIADLKAKRVLDYGCGQSNLWRDVAAAGAEVARFDPSIPEISQRPQGKFDLIVNTDVMEHIPEQDVDDVLADIRKFSANAYFAIAMYPAGFLPDGKPLHCTIKPAAWWQEKIAQHFDPAILAYETPGGLCIIVTWPVGHWGFFRRIHVPIVHETSIGTRLRFFPRLWRSIKKRLRRRRVKSLIKSQARARQA